jgi:hypothetical protein
MANTDEESGAENGRRSMAAVSYPALRKYNALHITSWQPAFFGAAMETIKADHRWLM